MTINAMQRDIMRNRLERALQLRNMNPNGAFLDTTLLDQLLDDHVQLLADHAEIQTTLRESIKRSVEHLQILQGEII